MKDFAQQIKHVETYIQLPFAYNHWYIAGLKDSFERKPQAKTLLERSLVFFRTEAGKLVAMQNRCLHRSFPLSEGYLQGDQLVCRYHGIEYNSDGSIHRIPIQKSCPDKKLRTYPVREFGPFAWIWMGDPDHPEIEERFPDVAFFEDGKHRTILEEMGINSNYLLMQENLNDLSHFVFLHMNSFPFEEWFFDLPWEVKKTPEGVFCNRIDRDPKRAIGALPPDIQERVKGRPVERHDGGYAVSPGVFKGFAPIIVGAADDPDREVFGQHIMHFMTPETRTKTHYWWSISGDYALDNDMYWDFTKTIVSNGFAEDKWACEHMQSLLEDDNIAFEEMVIAGDKAGMLFRRVMLDWIEDEQGA
ncbi:MAG: Rieske 2Fe-2S domain-containing protein [Pseudomonadota bacterium]